jgi:hypothetical protein
MTQEPDDHIILPDRFHNTHKIHTNQSGIFRIGVLKKIGKIKPVFFQIFQIKISIIRSTIPKMGRKN